MSTTRLIRWANAHSPDRLVEVGRVAVRPLEYVREGTPPVPRPFGSLAVTAVGAAERPIFHASTGLFGFLELAPGDLRIHVRDPSRRYLDRAVAVVVPDFAATIEALRAGVEPPAGQPGSVIVDLPMRIGPAFRLGGGETSLWGRVLDGDGAPLPFARIRAQTDTVDVVTWSDASGDYVVWLRGQRSSIVIEEPEEDDDDIGPPPDAGAPPAPPEDTFEVSLTVHRLDATLAPDGDPLRSFPAAFDDLAPGAAGFDDVFADPPLERDETVTLGTRTRLDLEVAG